MVRLRSWVPYVLAAFLVLLLAGAALGCGGSGAESSTATTTEAAAAPVPVAATTVATGDATAAVIGTTVSSTDQTPADVRTALKDHRPIVVLFYVASSSDDDRVRLALERLKPKYPDVLFLSYEYRKPKAYGDLAQQFKVNYPPQAVFIDGKGVVRSVTSGYIDEGTLNQHIVNISQS